MLAKGLDAPQLPPAFREIPVGEELVAMQCGPFDREAERARREPALEDLQANDPDLDLELAVLRVEVRRPVVVESASG